MNSNVYNYCNDGIQHNFLKNIYLSTTHQSVVLLFILMNLISSLAPYTVKILNCSFDQNVADDSVIYIDVALNVGTLKNDSVVLADSSLTDNKICHCHGAAS